MIINGDFLYVYIFRDVLKVGLFVWLNSCRRLKNIIRNMKVNVLLRIMY